MGTYLTTVPVAYWVPATQIWKAQTVPVGVWLGVGVVPPPVPQAPWSAQTPVPPVLGVSPWVHHLAFQLWPLYEAVMPPVYTCEAAYGVAQAVAAFEEDGTMTARPVAASAPASRAATRPRRDGERRWESVRLGDIGHSLWGERAVCHALKRGWPLTVNRSRP
ncbi:hypothetical protein KCH_17230 [Kitasatospora cheerisanensis KCTC 2395]|uniref:Uncharacterized protein n=1 Tax=Kitasatospora cheerisanensis KCTC 2395 TaxID=1348663 RepID=A0A066YZH9_9ACTN|nr:hypothetical protein KCH_17230 [Kitasatospora cheerisanensis KCTC 2395]